MTQEEKRVIEEFRELTPTHTRGCICVLCLGKPVMEFFLLQEIRKAYNVGYFKGTDNALKVWRETEKKLELLKKEIEG